MCNSHMFALPDARDYSFSKVPLFGTRRRDDWPIKLRKQRDIISLQVPLARVKKWATNRGKTPESRESFQRLKPGILPKLSTGYYCLTTRANVTLWNPLTSSQLLEVVTSKNDASWTLCTVNLYCKSGFKIILLKV